MLNSLVKKSKFISTKRVGRGESSGLGKTCGRGHKGQKARSGVSLVGFEGGQNPLYMRLPKRGFNSLGRRTKKETFVLDISFLDQISKKHNIKTFDIEVLKAKGIARKYHRYLRLIGSSAINIKISVVCDSTTTGSRASFKNSGSKLTFINQGE